MAPSAAASMTLVARGSHVLVMIHLFGSAANRDLGHGEPRRRGHESGGDQILQPDPDAGVPQQVPPATEARPQLITAKNWGVGHPGEMG